MNRKMFPNFSTFSVIGAALILTTPAANGFEPRSNQIMPYEYSKIQTLVGRIQKYNDLQNLPLTFTIVNGRHGRWMAEELRLCKEDECSYYENLNPFRGSSRQEKEIIRQSQLYGDIQGSAYSNGTIKISQATFRILQGKDNFLACLLAHEISHVITHDMYEVSKASVEGGFDGDSEEDEIRRAAIYQKNELDADKDAIIMVANSGFPQDSCKKFEIYLSKSMGVVDSEDQKGSHPSTKRRVTHAEQITKNYKPPQKAINNMPRDWRYDSENNFLFLAPNEIE